MRSAAVMVVALVLLATAVTGRESAPAPAAEPARLASAPAFALPRPRNDEPVEELFGVPPPPAPPQVLKAEPPAPTTPPLPFSYLGRMQKGGRVTLYLLRSQEMVIVEEGATLEGVYRLERIAETSAHFVYLPLGTEQQLAIPPAP